MATNERVSADEVRAAMESYEPLDREGTGDLEPPAAPEVREKCNHGNERTEWLQGLKVGDKVVVWSRAPATDQHEPGLVWWATAGYVSVAIGGERGPERYMRFLRRTGEGSPKPKNSWETRYTLEPMPKE